MREVNPAAVLENDKLRISFDDKGRIIALRSKVTGTEFLTYPGLEENWRIMVLTGGHPVYYIWGKDQTPAEVSRTATGVTFRYRGLVGKEQHYAIDVDFTASLVDDEARFDLRVVNGHDQRIREAWYPILGGFQGFEEAGQAQMVHLAKSRTLARDILHRGLPGHEYLFVVEGETAQYYYPGEQMQWIDLYSQEQGLYVSCDDKSLTTTVFRLEKYPPEHGSTGAPWVSELALFPEDTPRWMKIMVGKLIAIDPGETWQSPPAVIWPHAGDWHTAAKHYRAWADTWMKWPQRAAWLKDYVGWQHIVGKTYLNEVYHTFDDYIGVMEEAQQKSGVDTLMVYGHTEIGCEGSDYTMTPAENLGGPEGFRRMCDALHARGMKVMVLTHRQSAINMELPEYKHFEPWTIKDRLGRPRTEIWWKTTVESLMTHNMGHYEATGPVWARVCPYCDAWWEGFRDELKTLIDMGLDGAQLDTIGTEGNLCYATNHGHKPGTSPMPKLAERLAWLREEIRAYKPEFVLCGEEFGDWLFQYLDLPYSRHRADDAQVFRYTFPETKENVAVSAYSYDQVNKGLMLGMGMDIEVWGLKKSVLACPELADYIKQVVEIRRAFPDYLMNGRFMDTLKASVDGAVRYAVHEGPQGLAVVLWNNSNAPQDCRVAFTEGRLEQGTLCKPGEAMEGVRLPCNLTIAPHRAVAIIAE